MASSTLRMRLRGAHRHAAASAMLLTCTLAASPAWHNLAAMMPQIALDGVPSLMLKRCASFRTSRTRRKPRRPLSHCQN